MAARGGLSFRRSFLAEAAQGGSDVGLQALEHLPDVYFFAKDRARVFVLCNGACARLLGASSPEQVIGKRDEDFSPGHVCESYEKDDRAVLDGGQPIEDRLELVRRGDGSLAWHNTTKFPVRGRGGRIVGVAGVTRDLNSPTLGRAGMALAPAMEAIFTNYQRRLSVAELARTVALSPSQFRRQFHGHFQTSPLQYLIKVRIDVAAELLTTTGRTILQIALDAGFCDQSHFTNLFVKHKKVTPRRYRQKYGRPWGEPPPPSPAPVG